MNNTQQPVLGLAASAPASEVRPPPVLRRDIAVFAVSFWAAGTVVGIVWTFVETGGFWFFAGALACLIVSVPLVVGRHGFEIISPWSLIVLAVYLAFGLRGLFISLGINGTRTLDVLYFRGRPPEAFFVPTLLLLAGLVLFTLGYISAERVSRGRRPRLTAKPHLRSSTIFPAVALCATVGLIAFVIFARSTGGFDLSVISAKRTAIDSLDVTNGYESHGEFRALNGLSAIAFWLQIAAYCYKREAHRFPSRRGVWVVLLFVNAALLPVYSSKRSELVYILLGAIIIEYSLNSRFRVRGAIGLGLGAIILTSALSSLRNADDTSVTGVTVDGRVLVDTFVLTRTFADVPTSGNIIRAVPDRLPYAEGSTIVAWLVAPVPRSLWPGKPLISAGPVLGSAIYGNKTSGVPPGIIAESYWNFGLGGILVIPLLCGWILRRLSDRWAPYAASSPSAAIVVASVSIKPGLDLMTNSIGSAPYQYLLALVLLVPVLIVVASDTDERSSAGETGVSADHRYKPRDVPVLRAGSARRVDR